MSSRRSFSPSCPVAENLSGKSSVLPVVEPSPIQFHDVAKASGISFQWGHASKKGLTILDLVGHGCAFLDFNNDRKLDILLVAEDHCLLYKNRGDGSFEDVTETAFPNAPRKPRLIGCSVADFDGDGYADIFISGYGRNILYHNERNGTFKDVTAGSGLESRSPDDWLTSSAWANLDGSAVPDLYVCRYVLFNSKQIQLCRYPDLKGADLMMACGPLNYRPQKGSLFKNLGKGRFKDITKGSGLDETHGNGLACMFCDFQGTGKPGLYVSNDELQADLFAYQGSGKFKNVAVEKGVAFDGNGGVAAGMGIDWGDFDGDGKFDLLVSDFSGRPKSLYRNEGDVFSQATFVSGLGNTTLQSLTFGATFIDADNDGKQDIVLTNGHIESEVELTDRVQTYAQATQILRNTGGSFEDFTTKAGKDFMKHIVGRGIAVGDYDGDGRLDLLIADDEGAPLLLHNDSPAKNNWISLRCEDRSGNDAIGARVTFALNGKKRVGEVRSSGSYLSSNASALHFGLGDYSSIESLEIRWSNGSISRYRDVKAGRNYLATQDARALTLDSPKKL